jgi:hypothetical protein
MRLKAVAWAAIAALSMSTACAHAGVTSGSPKSSSFSKGFSPSSARKPSSPSPSPERPSSVQPSSSSSSKPAPSPTPRPSQASSNNYGSTMWGGGSYKPSAAPVAPVLAKRDSPAKPAGASSVSADSSGRSAPAISPNPSSGSVWSQGSVRPQMVPAVPVLVKRDAVPVKQVQDVAPVVQELKTSMGTFGSKGRVAAGAAGIAGAAAVGIGAHSALSEGLSQNAAQENALATFDAREAEKAALAKSAASEHTAKSKPSYPARAAQDEEYAYQSGSSSDRYHEQRSAPAPVVIHQNSGSSDNWLWYNMGRASNQSSNSPSSTRATATADSNTTGSPSAPTPRPAPASGSSFWSIFVWLLILSAIGWAVWYVLNKKKKPAEPAPRTYSL